MVAQSPAAVQARKKQIAVEHHPRKKIVEVMRNAAYKTTNDLHFLGIPQLLLGVLPLRYVLHHGNCGFRCAIRVSNQGNTPPQPSGTLVLSSIWHLHLIGIASATRKFVEQLSFPLISIGSETEEFHLAQFVMRVAEKFFGGRIAFHDPPIQITLQKSHG